MIKLWTFCSWHCLLKHDELFLHARGGHQTARPHSRSFEQQALTYIAACLQAILWLSEGCLRCRSTMHGTTQEAQALCKARWMHDPGPMAGPMSYSKIRPCWPSNQGSFKSKTDTVWSCNCHGRPCTATAQHSELRRSNVVAAIRFGQPVSCPFFSRHLSADKPSA